MTRDKGVDAPYTTRMSLVFDTLKLSKSLGRAFTPEQAEVLTEALTINVSEGLATKADLAVLSAEVKAEIAALDAKLTGEIAALDAKLTGEIAALDTKLTGSIAALDTKLTGSIAALDTKLTSNIAALDTKLTGNIAALDTKLTTRIAAVETALANTKSELVRWIVTSFVGNVVAMVTISIAVAKLVAHP